MHTLTTLLAVTLVLTTAAVVGGCWLAVRTTRRLAARVLAWRPPVPRRTASTLSWRPLVPQAAHLVLPRGEVSAVRRQLATDVRAAVRAGGAGRAAGRPVEELSRLTGRLERQARELDLDLAVVAREPDAARRRELLAALHDELGQLRSSCRQVRDGVHAAGGLAPRTTGQLLAEEVQDEVQRLALWASSYRELRGQR